MGVNAALAKWLQAHARKKALAHVAVSFDLVLLVQHVETTGGVLLDDALGEPVAQVTGGARVAVVGVGVAGLRAVELDADAVVGAAVVERLLQSVVDDIV